MKKLSRREQCLGSFALENMHMSRKSKAIFDKFDQEGLTPEQRIAALKKRHAR
ncbi:hypothetical protein PsalMR5_04921 (plasmid) [Piscirickettsia salmonis]|uniref:hypothetical protein n=1 Tax=Piscirickettsia salmonis TaxID=1238 RepID=UPI0012BAA22E|nr:hypothetical protein [Piscirickettsia salmonis]QGP57401.1 hypothetical protein PsalSR1_04890 [Piscirickettsia salmonis]QGP66996.1 hypothetical protein PsalMR5_04921 [Piscirickettsia salmonis]